MREPRLELEHKILRFLKPSGPFARALATVDQRPIEEINELLGFLSPQDRMRLLNLQIWSMRYHVSLSYLLHVLLQQHFVKHRKTGKRLIGIRIDSLTSRKVEEYIEERIMQDFPNGELEQQYRVECEQRIIQGRPELQDIDDLEGYEDQLVKLEAQRQRMQKRLRRPWRNNPWR